MFEPAPEAEAASAPEMTDAPAPEVTDAAPQPEVAAKPAAKEEGKEHPFWYRKEIEKERKKNAALERELEQTRSKAPPTNLPDPAQDPRAYFETQRVIMRLESSEDRFTDKHGEAELEAVKEWLTTRPDIEAWAIQQRHPWGAAHQQYQREKLSAEIGDDPNTWREKERQRIRDEILAEMGEGETGAMTAAPAPRLPQSAASVRSANPRGSIEKKSPFTHKFG